MCDKSCPTCKHWQPFEGDGGDPLKADVVAVGQNRCVPGHDMRWTLAPVEVRRVIVENCDYWRLRI